MRKGWVRYGKLFVHERRGPEGGARRCSILPAAVQQIDCLMCCTRGSVHISRSLLSKLLGSQGQQTCGARLGTSFPVTLSPCPSIHALGTACMPACCTLRPHACTPCEAGAHHNALSLPARTLQSASRALVGQAVLSVQSARGPLGATSLYQSPLARRALLARPLLLHEATPAPAAQASL